jgi:hypothetical protein
VTRRALLAAALLLLPLGVAAEGYKLSDENILGPPPGLQVQSLRLRFTHFDQEGRGYQSQADRHGARLPGSEELRVEQPQLELVATQGKLTHRLYVPVDVVTAASADAIDTMSSASRVNEAVNVDLTTTYHHSAALDALVRVAFHAEEPFRSWQIGAGGAHTFAEDNAVLSASVHQLLDELDRFNQYGTRFGRVYRSTTNANLGLTQLLSPTTVANVSYGATLQRGELSNTWNAVALTNGKLGREFLPRSRLRHAVVARIAQALPWDAALHASYRFYADSWQIFAHTLEYDLYQRLGRALYVRFDYRIHTQNAPPFWTTMADRTTRPRTADSDLAELNAQTLGGALNIDVPAGGGVRDVHVDVGYERYFRSNHLRVNVYTCGVGFRF